MADTLFYLLMAVSVVMVCVLFGLMIVDRDVLFRPRRLPEAVIPPWAVPHMQPPQYVEVAEPLPERLIPEPGTIRFAVGQRMARPGSGAYQPPRPTTPKPRKVRR